MKIKNILQIILKKEWYDKFEKIKLYIDMNNKILYVKDNNKQISVLGEWINTTQKNYKNIKIIMKNENIYNKWTEFINDHKYKNYFNK